MHININNNQWLCVLYEVIYKLFLTWTVGMNISFNNNNNVNINMKFKHQKLLKIVACF